MGTTVTTAQALASSDWRTFLFFTNVWLVTIRTYSLQLKSPRYWYSMGYWFRIFTICWMHPFSHFAFECVCCGYILHNHYIIICRAIMVGLCVHFLVLLLITGCILKVGRDQLCKSVSRAGFCRYCTLRIPFYFCFNQVFLIFIKILLIVIFAVVVMPRESTGRILPEAANFTAIFVVQRWGSLSFHQLWLYTNIYVKHNLYLRLTDK